MFAEKWHPRYQGGTDGLVGPSSSVRRRQYHFSCCQDPKCRTARGNITNLCGLLGPAVNKEKSSIYFSLNTYVPDKLLLKQTLNISVEAFSDRYLGLPTTVGKITSGTFDHIGERSRSKMQGWSERLFAYAGRETLIKSIAQAIPTFSMICFVLTKKVCKSLTSGMAR